MLVKDLLDKIENKNEVLITFYVGVTTVKGGKKEYETQAIRYNDFDLYNIAFIRLKNNNNVSKQNINGMRIDKVDLTYKGYECGDYYINITVKYES